MTSEVKDDLQINNILVTTFSADMTRFYQPLDLTVNGRAQRFIARKFNCRYFQHISDELESGKSLQETNVKLHLLILKPLHVVGFYNYITSVEEKEIVLNGWKAAGIYGALNMGSTKLRNIHPLHDMNPLIVDNAIHD